MRIDSTDATSKTTVRIPETGSERQRIADKIDTSLSVGQNKRNLPILSEQEKKDFLISDKVVIDAIERANKAISIANRRFEYSIHEKTKEIMIKVIDSNTEEVIREIPSEKILDMVAGIWEMAGLIVDERR